MAEDRLRSHGFHSQLGPEERDGLQVRPAVTPTSNAAQVPAHVGDEVIEAAGQVLALAGCISFHRSQAKTAPSPPQRSTGEGEAGLDAARVAGQVSSRSRLSQGPPLARL